MELGDTTECHRRVQTIREIVETVNTSRFVALTMHWQSALTALLGQIDDAEAAAREAADLWSSLGTRDAVAFGVGLRYLPRGTEAGSATSSPTSRPPRPPIAVGSACGPGGPPTRGR